ncbi:uncharacterized protein LOC124545158 [Schistocerca americana]|uniref:uncharacterized protein LOC124545158 n=1 Tax=Schistocerca americana TaxID=7009 RepID=UPI001F4F33F2|nr:uncharacterized protein LOC124545158 [Schistocerca americana]
MSEGRGAVTSELVLRHSGRNSHLGDAERSRGRTGIKEQTPPEADTHGDPPDYSADLVFATPHLLIMKAVFAVVILGVVAAASAATVPASTSVYQQPQYQPLQYQPVVQSQQVVGGRVVPAVYPGSVASNVYTSGVVPSVYSSGIVRNVYPANVAPVVGGAYPYYPTV